MLKRHRLWITAFILLSIGAFAWNVEARFGGWDTFMQFLGRENTWTADQTFDTGTHLILPSDNDATTPTLAFGNADTGFYESADDTLRLAINTTDRWIFTNSDLGSSTVGGGRILSAGASDTVPGFTFQADADTGVGHVAADQLSFIAGGVEAMRIIETATGDISITVLGTAPGLSSCGTTPTVTGSDTAGKITIGTGATTSCTVTFTNAFATNAPACVIAGDNSAITYAATTSTTVLTITSSGDMASDVISYICLGIL